MSNALSVPDAARTALVRGYAEFFLDDGPGDPQLLLFTNTRPANGATAGASPGVTILLSKPSGVMEGGMWRLVMKDASGYQAVANGPPTWGRLISAAGLWAGDGDAGGPSDDVIFKVQGGVLYAGGYALIGDIKLR